MLNLQKPAIAAGMLFTSEEHHTMNQYRDQNTVILWIGNNFSKLEMTFVLSFLLGMMFKIAGFGPGRLFIGFGLTFLAVVYFLYAFVPDRQTEFVNIFMRKIMIISWAMVIVGIMFFYLNYAGFIHQLMAGLLSLTVSFIFLLIKAMRTINRINKAELIRSAIIFFVGVYIFLKV